MMLDLKEPQLKAEERFLRSQRAYDSGYLLGAHPWTEHPLQDGIADKFVGDLFALGSNPRVVDIGCGPGVKARLLEKMGLKVVGVDMSQEAIKKAQQMARREGLEDSLTFMQGDVRNLPQLVGEHQFEGLFDYQCLASIPREFWPDTIESYAKVLKPGGKLLIDLLDIESKTFHGSLDNKVTSNGEHVFEHDPNKPEHQGLEWEDGLLIVLEDRKQVETDFSKHFKILEIVPRQHPTKPERRLLAALMEVKTV